MDNTTNKRLYSEKEIGALIQRATELQEQSAATSGRGLSLDEIEHIAEELGLDPDFIEKAALEMDFDLNQERPFHILGAPFLIDHALMLDGEITDGQWERLLLKFRQLTGQSGEVHRTGNTREWSRGTEDGGMVVEKTQVQLTTEGEYTSVQIRKYFKGAALLAYALSFFIGATITGIFLDGSGVSELLGLVLVAAGGLGSFTAARVGVGLWARNQKKKLKKLAGMLREVVSQSRTSEGSVKEKGRKEVEIPREENRKQEEPGSGRQRTRS